MVLCYDSSREQIKCLKEGSQENEDPVLSPLPPSLQPAEGLPNQKVEGKGVPCGQCTQLSF